MPLSQARRRKTIGLKVAIFGGTFDPIHNAHLRVAREAADRLQLDRVLLVPSANPPHKPSGTTTPYEDRFRMVALACACDPRFEPSRLEDGQGKSYSIDTIERVKAQVGPTDELYFLIGADAFAEIGSWHRSADVLHAVEFVVVSRPGYAYPIPPGAKVIGLETLALVISSSEIRRKLDSGEPVEELPDPVLGYIREHGLYQ
ncbi:nicotinate-nucleotide adenylyltransferase [uncultured Paludibaculum sp.]|uniref:nicotinate-nucleotide adenylyltransferase n=1 Tax=uncultured Paludibaculum sp. TaxID=1765020 RepID=UPI002AAB39F2|nr:nicotinate-nucleotide adenylyltransferase [uncultured Paludibaculum sp.]